MQIAVAASVILSVMFLGMIFEDRKKAMTVEVLRFVLTFVMTGVMSLSGFLPHSTLAAVAVFGAGSLWVLQRTGLHELVEVE